MYLFLKIYVPYLITVHIFACYVFICVNKDIIIIIYADDLCVTAQYHTFQEVEQKIEESLGELTHYYRSNSLRANPDKTQVTAFHLRNREAKRSLQVSWNGVDLENTDTPKYLGVTLDRTLSYKDHTYTTPR